MTGTDNDEFKPLERLRYFTGQFLTADDFNTEQQYWLDKRRLHNRYLHGFGVVSGLDVSVDNNSVHVSPGLALDPGGNEIAVGVCNELPLTQKGRVLYVLARYVERETDPVPSVGGGSAQNSRVEEGFEITIGSENPCSGYQRGERGSVTTDADRGIPIARLLLSRSRWRIDRKFRRPRVR